MFSVCSGQCRSKLVCRRNSGEAVTGSWTAKAHGCTIGVKAGLAGLIQQTSFCSSSYWKKFMLVLIEICHNTQSITVCWVWDCLAADWSGFPCWPLLTTETTTNAPVSIRTGPQSNEGKWFSLMNHIFFYIMWIARCLCVDYLGNTRHQDPIWTESKLAEAVWCFGQFSPGRPSILPSMDVNVTFTTYLIKPWWLWPLSAAQSVLPQSKNDLGTVWGAQQCVWGVDLASKFLRCHSNQTSMRCAGQQVWSMYTPPHNLLDLNCEV